MVCQQNQVVTELLSANFGVILSPPGRGEVLRSCKGLGDLEEKFQISSMFCRNTKDMRTVRNVI